MSTSTPHHGEPATPPQAARPTLSGVKPPLAPMPEPEKPQVEGGAFTAQGTCDARTWQPVKGMRSCGTLSKRWRTITKSQRNITRDLRECRAQGETLTADETWLYENARLLLALGAGVADFLRDYRGPGVRGQNNAVLPRVSAVAAGYLREAKMTASESSLAGYIEGIQQVENLWMGELWALKPALEFVLLEQIAAQAAMLPRYQKAAMGPKPSSSVGGPGRVQKAIAALRAIQEIDWQNFFEQHNAAEQVLRRDPAGVYAQMDVASRQMYRTEVEELARHSPYSEEEVARQAVYLAIRATDRTRTPESARSARRGHVGYYLVDVGRNTLKRRLEYKPSPRRRIRELVLEWPEVYYVVGVEFMTIALAFLLLGSFGVVIPLFAGLLLLIPASQAAVGIVNNLTGIIAPPRKIPKLDYSEGVPAECTTLVAVPCLLLSEAEVRRNFAALEIRYLGNRDPHLHYALVTDSPDADARFDEHDELIDLCSKLIQQFNEKYGRDQQGGFLHLHRHRVYNPSEGAWMGWERKRGKLLDLNDLLLKQGDSFPVKSGDLSVLSAVRYVITLDADTKLPPGSARKMIGALAHPLNRAVIDPETNTVVEGYGILQPRVSVSIESAHHSRLAAIYSGQTAFDIYTQAASDIYQDLFGEGSFTGKGIYDVEAVQRVLRRRFPTNALLSHDLIEGAYTRAGLVSDVVVIDDYPSHFSAYCRRLHRWVRGDWQIMSWLLPKVPDFYGRQVPNPLTFISRWKIFDNLRRSVIDIGLFLLLVLGWTVLPGGPVYWTLVTLALLLLPTYCQFVFALFSVRRKMHWAGFCRERINDLVTGHLQVFVMVVFLPHQALVMVDAITRTIARLTITHSNLLEWETAAEAEEGKKKTPVETYLRLTPYVALAIALGLAIKRPSALLVASPLLVLWLMARYFTAWVNRRPVEDEAELTAERESFLRLAALRTWRYFDELSTEKYHWLVPDNVQLNPPAVAPRISPTNLGLLLNAQTAAQELGYLTLPEYAETAERTLTSVKQLTRYQGHFYNWYDIQTVEPLEPRFISTVDSGNLAASLWTLKQSSLGLIHQPLFPKNLWRGLHQHLELLDESTRQPSVPEAVRSAVLDLAECTKDLELDASLWIGMFPRLEQQVQRIESLARNSAGSSRPQGHLVAPDWEWWLQQTAARLQRIREQMRTLTPWALPEYFPLSHLLSPLEKLTLDSLPDAIAEVDKRLDATFNNPQSSDAERSTAPLLRRRLPAARENAALLLRTFNRLAEDSNRLVEEMDFRFLYNAKKKVFSIGYDATAGALAPSGYDLLASEARTAVFVAMAKGEVNQEAWFHLGRSETLALGSRVLLSWSGTMFEYLMPALWMRTYPDTIMAETMRAAVRCQQKYGRGHGIPWGISEAAYSERDAQGIYRYRAFGLPQLALDSSAPSNRVVSPYSSFLALLVDSDAALRNLENLREMGCLGSLGFYEACDFTPVNKPEDREFELVQCWMAHHQGMSLLAISNLLNQFSVRKWFHKEPRVMAAELFLHEKLLLSAPITAEAAHFFGEEKRPGRSHVKKTRLAASVAG